MALGPKQLLQTNRDADRLWSTDKTGVYNADSNDGGWGDPNPELNESALLFLAVRKGSTETYLEAVGTQVFNNPAATNATENSCEFVLAEDGHHRVYLFQFDVSDDGVTYLKDGEVIAEEDYFFYDGDLCQKTGGEIVVVEVEDYPNLIDDANVTQDYAENIFYPKLMMKLQNIIQTQISYREKNQTQEEEYYKGIARDLRDDLESAYNLFWSGLTIQANSLIESLTNKYSTY